MFSPEKKGSTIPVPSSFFYYCCSFRGTDLVEFKTVLMLSFSAIITVIRLPHKNILVKTPEVM
jgi:hypothetical protein